jgi:hypothetical protein
MAVYWNAATDSDQEDFGRASSLRTTRLSDRTGDEIASTETGSAGRVLHWRA